MILLSFLFIGTTELLLIGGMALLLFGGKKLPEMMRGLGKGVREFKKGVHEVEEDLNGQPRQESETDGHAAAAHTDDKQTETDHGK